MWSALIDPKMIKKLKRLLVWYLNQWILVMEYILMNSSIFARTSQANYIIAYSTASIITSHVHKISSTCIITTSMLWLVQASIHQIKAFYHLLFFKKVKENFNNMMKLILKIISTRKLHKLRWKVVYLIIQSILEVLINWNWEQTQ